MALTKSDFFQPNGHLRTSEFPDSVTPAAYVDQWLSEADDKVSANELPDEAADGVKAKEEAKKAWTYYRAYDFLANEMEASPVSASIEGKGSVTYERGQLRRYRTKAESHRAKYDSLVYRYDESEPYKSVQYTI